MRSINPETGRPYPRKRPVNFSVVRNILKHRQAHKKIIDQGFVELRSHQSFPADTHIGGSGKYSDVCLHPDGTRIYVKPVGHIPKFSPETTQQAAYENYNKTMGLFDRGMGG